MAAGTRMGRPSSPTAGFAAAVRMGGSPACPCAVRMSGCPVGTVHTPGESRFLASAVLSGCVTRHQGWESSPSQPKDPSFLASSLPQPLASPVQNGARPGAPALPPAGWAWPPVCPTRTTCAAWRASAGCACVDPAPLPGAAALRTVSFRAGCCRPVPTQAILSAGSVQLDPLSDRGQEGSPATLHLHSTRSGDAGPSPPSSPSQPGGWPSASGSSDLFPAHMQSLSSTKGRLLGGGQPSSP